MINDRDDSTGINREAPPRYETDPLEQQSPQPAFDDFNAEEEDYEEPDRDTDYASGFRELSIEEDEFEDLLEDASYEDKKGDEEPSYEELSAETYEEPSAETYKESPARTYKTPSAESYNEPAAGFAAASAAGSATEPAAGLDDTYSADYEDDVADSYDTTGDGPDLFATTLQTEKRWQEPAIDAGDEAEEWLDEEVYPDEEVMQAAQPWPLGLIAVAIIALLLLGAGGYGVMQQRSATQEEIRQLRAALATAASPQDVSESRASLQEEKQIGAQLAAQVESLQVENRRLTDTISGLEAQLEAQQSAMAKEVAKARQNAAAPVPKRAPKQTAVASPSSSATASGGKWFVNFGSYGQSEIAQQWVSKLKPSAGKVINAPSTRDGRTFYRVRVIGLPSREGAEKVARTLERQYGLPKLWIGKQD